MLYVDFSLNSLSVGMVNGLTEGTDSFDIGFIGESGSRGSAKVVGNGVGLHLMVDNVLV